MLGIVQAIQSAEQPERAETLTAYLTEYDQLARMKAKSFGIELPTLR